MLGERNGFENAELICMNSLEMPFKSLNKCFGIIRRELDKLKVGINKYGPQEAPELKLFEN